MAYKIFINPGHCPAKDPGAVNASLNINEADICASVGQKVADLLEQRRFHVALEQSNNLCGEEGQDWCDSVCAHANESQANIFVSIHCNAFTSDSAHGVEVFHHPESVKGKKLAEAISKHIVPMCGMELRSPNMERGRHLAVCTKTSMPAVLVELGFISNPDDADKLINKQDSFALAIVKGIEEYFSK